ncbi:unnamed protein product [Darwinula stevensoni]|uniref:Uncharacterized protein n=1 Tax=Darwinula stevensoni TaxID=69355 RepID=A0A7R9A1E8_9CRUS|nr:unnamed protein product [Darwinula stevensoni]CAG0883309.1 unnamed protein product [Darwinula stevensoni]
MLVEVKIATMSNRYNLKWNSHHAETFQIFENLRHREMFVDATLSCNGQFLKAHKLILCAGSGYFERILNKDGAGTPTIHFYGVEMHLLKLLVEFMYCGEVEVPASDLEKFIEIAENLEVKGLKGDKSKSSGSYNAAGTTIPVADVEDALAHKRKSAVQAWKGLGESQYPPVKVPRSHTVMPRARSQQFIGPNSQQNEAIASPSQAHPNQAEPSTSTSTDEVVIKDEGEEEEVDSIQDVMDSASAAEESQFDDQSQASYFGEGMEGEPEAPMNIPPEVDPQDPQVSYGRVPEDPSISDLRVLGTKKPSATPGATEMFVDATLSCNGQFLKAHKLILCAGSGYFERILNKDGAGTPTIHFYGVEMHLLKLLVEFMYCGEVEVPASDLEKFIEIAENLEVKGLKGDKSKSSGSYNAAGTTIPVADVEDALAHKRKSAVQAWKGLGESQYPPVKVPRSHTVMPRARSQQFIGPNSQQNEAIASPSQAHPNQAEPSTSTSTDEVVIKDEGEEEEVDSIQDVMDSASAAEESQFDDQSQASYFGEGMEGEPEAPMNIPPEVDPQTVGYCQSFVWSGQTSSGLRQWFCSACNYKTHRKDHAVLHSRKHSKEKPYACTMCPRRFSQKSGLNYHIFAHHINARK